MKFLSVREVRDRPGELCRQAAEDTVVITSNGRPTVLAVGVVHHDLVEEQAREMRLAAGRVLLRLAREQASRAGASELTMGEVNEEIRRARGERTP
jgi:prevent-host-death family protein